MRWKALVALISLAIIFVISGCSNYNQPPFKPEALSPENGEKGVPFDVTLSWKGGDPDGDVVTYTVYIGQGDLKPASETTSTTLEVHLSSYGTYKWKVVAEDPYGHTSESDIWTFSTVEPPKPSVDEVAVVGENEIEIVDVSNPLSPSLKKTISMSKVSSAYFGKEGIYAAGCYWVSKLGKGDLHEMWNVKADGCVKDIAVDGYVFLSMGKDGVEYLNPSSPSTSRIVEEYAKGMDSAFNTVYIAAGGEGLYEMDASTLRVSTITVGKWVSDVKWSGNSLYFLSGSGVGVVGGDTFSLENPKSFDAYEYMVYALSGDVLHIIDFSDRNSPTEMATITLEDAKDIKAVGNYIYAVGDKFYSVDVSDPKRPMITGVNDSIKGLKFAQN